MMVLTNIHESCAKMGCKRQDIKHGEIFRILAFYWMFAAAIFFCSHHSKTSLAILSHDTHLQLLLIKHISYA